jgi:hypothetical protein
MNNLSSAPNKYYLSMQHLGHSLSLKNAEMRNKVLLIFCVWYNLFNLLAQFIDIKNYDPKFNNLTSLLLYNLFGFGDSVIRRLLT